MSRLIQTPPLRFLIVALDLFVILGSSIFLKIENFTALFLIYISISWFITAYFISFYQVFRFTPLLHIVYILAKQLFLFSALTLAFFGINKNAEYSLLHLLLFLGFSAFGVSLIKISIFTILKKVRTRVGKNLKKIIVIGSGKRTKKLIYFFNENPAYGYDLLQVFEKDEFKQACEFIETGGAQEIYCSLADFTDKEVRLIVNLANESLSIVKFIPDQKEIFSRKLKFQNYGILPIISIQESPLELKHNRFLKRFFDIFVASLVFITILSWLTPLLAILIKLESKGPVFYKHVRNGLGYKEFHCYKFRSMKWRDPEDIDQVIKDDARVTKIGRFLRRSSIDELPQFYNVLLGEMSVVGPRPHMVKYNEDYIKRVERFMVRHLIKPGITGLAQISGYRGEVEKDSDIINRVRYDIFYLENWSLLMDVRIIAKTIVQLIKGDPKAY